MQQAPQALPPWYADAIIANQIGQPNTHNARSVLVALATDPAILKAVQAAIDKPPQPGVIGASHAQMIRQAIIKALETGK